MRPEVEVGRDLPVLRAGPFTIADFVRWAGYQENWLRIHYDPAYAVESARLTGCVQSGNHRTALVLRMVTDWLGPKGWVRRLTIRHAAPVGVGDTLECGGRVRAVTPRVGNGRAAVLDLWAVTEDGRKASDGEAVVEVDG
jgi:acyl dehydratase